MTSPSAKATEQIKKRSVRIQGHETSISIEEPFWAALKDIAAEERKSINQIVTEIDQKNPQANLSSALRIFILRHLQESLKQKEQASG